MYSSITVWNNHFALLHLHPLHCSLFCLPFHSVSIPCYLQCLFSRFLTLFPFLFLFAVRWVVQKGRLDFRPQNYLNISLPPHLFISYKFLYQLRHSSHTVTTFSNSVTQISNSSAPTRKTFYPRFLTQGFPAPRGSINSAGNRWKPKGRLKIKYMMSPLKPRPWNWWWEEYLKLELWGLEGEWRPGGEGGEGVL